MTDDLNIHDDFLDNFWYICRQAEQLQYQTLSSSNFLMNIEEGWTGLRTLDIKTNYPEVTRKIEETTDKIVDRLHFYRIDGKEKEWLQQNAEQALTPHRDTYPWAGVIYLWGNTGTYYNGELVEFKENRFVWYNGQELHMPDLTDQDRCVIVVFMLDKIA